MSGIWDASDGGSSPYTIKGNWNASTNTPDITTVTQVGSAYVVSVPGTFDLGGITTWNANDIAVKTTGGWARITPASATWGTITGTLSNQTDLQNTFNLKANDNAVVKLTGNQSIQQAYANSLKPQITTDATNGAVQVKRGSLADTDNLIEALNGAGVVKTAIKGNGNYVLPKEAGTGFLVDPASPTYGWKDLIGQIIPRVGGGAAPVFTAYRGGAVRNYAFATNDVIDNVTFHMPHDWVPGTNMYLHVHWGHNGTAISGNFNINWTYTYSKGYNQAGFIFEAEKTYSQSIPVTSITTHPRWGHFIDEFQFTTPGGSVNQLNTNTLEVDGLIELALQVTGIPTITGSAASNLPYIFLVDIHYQSTQMSTKGRNYPFY